MTVNELLLTMARCLVLTIIIEVIVGLVLGIKNKNDIIKIVIVNVITNPIVVFVPIVIYYYLGHNFYVISLLTLEVITVLFEGYIYKVKFDYKRLNPFYISLLLNLSSYFVGELINNFL